MKILAETGQFGDYLTGMWLQEKKEKKKLTDSRQYKIKEDSKNWYTYKEGKLY